MVRQVFSFRFENFGSANILREIDETLHNMQALGLFSRRSLLGRSNKSTVLLQKIAQENSLNRTGCINYNQYGKKEGVGFIPCTEKFVDNFLFYVYVPDYFVQQNGARRPTQKLVW